MTIRQSLNGPWQLLPADTFRQGFYPLDDDVWVEHHLPAHWQQHPLFERYVGKMVYRKRFALQGTGNREQGIEDSPDPRPLIPDPRYWLRLNGIFYWSQCYFNGVDLGRHEGYFIPQEHDVTRWIAEENTLIVEVECPDEHNKTGKRLITGIFSHWDCIDPTTNPGGIWLPVELITSGPTRIKQTLLQTERFSETVAELRFRAMLDAAQAGDVTLRWTVAPKNFAGQIQIIDQRRALAEGEQEIAGIFEVRDPQLWWTHDLGHPHCYTVTLSILHNDQVSDEHAVTFGIRQFELHDWIPYLNGVRLFIKGNNYAPGDVRIAAMTRERYIDDFQKACDSHMNMLRVHAHVDQPLLYEIADEAGVLLWQDFPLQWLYQRDVLQEACRQAQRMVELLYNHPSVVIWCMHNEPIYVVDLADERRLTKLRSYASVFIWSWNRDVMDTQLKRVAEKVDQTRPVVCSSGEYAVPFLRKGTDAHFYYGWFTIYGALRAWESVVRRFPDNIRFVTEFGAQSFPNLESCRKFIDTDIAKIDWEHLNARHQFLPTIMDHWLDWRTAPSLEALIELTQDYQIHINRFYIDRLRHHKYRPTSGILPFMFRDTGPAIQSAIIDYWGVPKRSYDAMRLAFSPQYIFTLLDRDEYPINAPINIPIYVVNDAHKAVSVKVEARLISPLEGELARITRDVALPSDCMAFEVDRLRLTPELVGVYRLHLSLKMDGDALAQEYAIVVRQNVDAGDAKMRKWSNPLRER
jgi:beta-mannosidase